jgi:hypothetical protein
MANEKRETSLAGVGLLTTFFEHEVSAAYIESSLLSILAEEGDAGIYDCLIGVINVAALAVNSLASETAQTETAVLQMLAQRLVDMPDGDSRP